MSYLPSHKNDMEIAQGTWQNRGYDLVRDPRVIKYKNSKWHCKQATQKHFAYRDWREFWSDAGFSLEQINISHYLSNEYKSQSPYYKSMSNESIRIYEMERQYAIDNGKGMKRLRLEEQHLEAEAKNKRNISSSSSSCSSSNNKEKQEDWTRK
ncbi:MAG: hypothetical protein EZS28_004783 [Streblomastix strix]|uniref:Uncharacterized protein n=1 Tax=Streblomastix strix TaxID=222440 RepID=A0A5J4WYZ8_9EUKA|nr:MAG: hypothetical protein EZS28_004783 [Streblomastix strix]